MKIEEDPTMYEHHVSYTKSVLCLKAKPSVTWEMGPPLSLRLLQGRVASRQTLDLLSSAIFPCSIHPLIAWGVILPSYLWKVKLHRDFPQGIQNMFSMWWEKPNSYGEFWEPCGWVTWAALTSMTDIMLPFSPPSWGMLRKHRDSVILLGSFHHRFGTSDHTHPSQKLRSKELYLLSVFFPIAHWRERYL